MLNHLIQLRKRLIYTLVVFGCLFAIFFYYSNDLFDFLLGPLQQIMPLKKWLVATQITSPVILPIKLAADGAVLMTIPFGLFQLWLFAAPGLYRNERQTILYIFSFSFLLFGLGSIFCFYGVLPFMFKLFLNAAPSGVQFMPDITSAVDFIMHMLLIFGLGFQVPLLCVILVRFKWVSYQTLKQSRSYVIVIAFILGMLLTPPDVLSQIMLALPLCFLYEIGLFFSRWIENKSRASTL